MTDLRGLKAPDLALFDDLARAAYADLPAAFRRMTGEILIAVDDFPDDEVMEEMELESPFDILGLFQGIGLEIGRAHV